MNKNQKVDLVKDRVTIRHVAEDAGVSVAAVSKVLRNAYGVSDALRSKVENSIEKLKYRPSTAARAMRGRTNTFGILAVELTNPFLPDIIEAANATLVKFDCKSLIGLSRSTTTVEASLIESMIDNRMDGVLIISPCISGEVLERYGRDIPIVVIAHHEPQSVTYDTVNSDDRKGVALAVEAAFLKGYSDLAMLSYENLNAPTSIVTVQRELSYLDEMTKRGRQGRIIRLPPDGVDRSAEIQSFLSATDRPRAVFVWSDLDAVPLINAARIRGIRVPEDLAIIGYDNSPVAQLPLIGLSSIDQNAQQLGQVAVEMLLERLEGRNTPRHTLIEPHIELRGSL